MFFCHYLTNVLKVVEDVSLNFLLVGHTKFSPDRFFGVLKKYLKHYQDFTETFYDVIEGINNSAHNNNS